MFTLDHGRPQGGRPRVSSAPPPTLIEIPKIYSSCVEGPFFPYEGPFFGLSPIAKISEGAHSLKYAYKFVYAK